MRIVAIDVGQKRTGIAVGDTQTRIVTPLDVLEMDSGANGGEALLARLAQIIRQEQPGRVVVGLPLNMDGTEGPQAKVMRLLASRLAERLAGGAEVVMHDERLSSAAADWAMAGTGLTHKQKKQRRDALAAAAILRGYLDAQRTPDGSHEGDTHPMPE